MSIIYASSPIVEAVCEFRFTPGQDWNSTYVGLVFEKVREEYPKVEDAVQFRGPALSDGGRQHVELAAVRATHFTKLDESGRIRIAPNLLAVSALKPYPGWKVLNQNIVDALDSYESVLGPSGIARVGLRYINEIQIPSSTVDLEEYFEFYAFVGKRLPQLHGMFNVAVEFPFENDLDLLRLVLRGVITGEPESMTMLLDLDYFRPTSESLEIPSVSEWLDRAHSNLKSVFEGAITDKTRDLFNEGSN